MKMCLQGSDIAVRNSQLQEAAEELSARCLESTFFNPASLFQVAFDKTKCDWSEDVEVFVFR